MVEMGKDEFLYYLSMKPKDVRCMDLIPLALCFGRDPPQDFSLTTERLK
jgi:hypothetical protein